MDELELRLAELESAQEDLEKDTGKLSVQTERTAALLDNALETLGSLSAAQQEMQQTLLNMQRHLDVLTSRIDQLDDTADLVEDHYAALKGEVNALSRDMDNIYEDMNVLAAETRNRSIKLKEQVERYFWDAESEDEEEDEEEEE